MVAMVRPWKEWFRVMMVLRPLPYLSKLYFRASLILIVEPLRQLPKNTLSMPVRVQSSFASLGPGWV